MKLKPDELEALHECLTWLRQPGTNPLNFYGDELEDFHKNCRILMDRIKHVLPEGSTRARIRATTRMSRQMHEGQIGETLGDESRGMVVVDFDGMPHKYDVVRKIRVILAPPKKRKAKHVSL
jgi:hypothetical protein